MGKPHLPSVVVLPRQPRLDQLLTVLPIAQVQQHQSVEVLALARESYAAGFVITFQLQSNGGVPFIDDAPALALRVTDDRGGEYPIQPAGATGEGARNAWQWRLAYRCTPALDAHACALQLEMPTSPGLALMQRGDDSSPPAS